MGEKSFTVIVSRLEEYFLHMGGGTKSNPVSIAPSDRVTALQAEVEQLKAMLSQNRPAHRTPNNPDLSCDNPNCRGKGHTIENCWKLGGGKQGQYSKWWKGKRDVPLLSPSANAATHFTNEEGPISQGHIYALSASALAAIREPVVPQGAARTFADSGALAHFFYDRAVFRNYVEK
ncbi:hypothetical protein C8R42DRAFT_726995 [Lentinula raphanica]|nr:hypothetical protein C8R42DRAFT_726995 [Lentinula raphanica]